MTTLLPPSPQGQKRKKTEEDCPLMMVSLPMDVIETHIIIRLPVQCLARFRCVSKYFNTLISSPDFIDLQFCRSRSTRTNRLLILNMDSLGLHCYDYNSLEFPPFYLPFPKTFAKENNRTVYTYGSCNGLLCLGNFSLELILLNPSTGAYIEIPALDSSVRSRAVGFGFDSSSDDYKVVAIVERGSRQISVYSLRENCWRLIEEQPISCIHDYINDKEIGVLIDNSLHWVFYSRAEVVKRLHISSFDLISEEWGKNIPLPEYCEEKVRLRDMFTEELGLLDGCLCLLMPIKSDQWPEPVDLWVMKEYGVKESWVKLLSGICHLSATQTLRMCPLGFRNDDNEEILLCRGLKQHKAPHGQGCAYMVQD